MPSYFEITTYILAPKTKLPALLQCHQAALEQLGLLNEEVARWLASIDWSPDEDYLESAPYPTIELQGASTTLQVRPAAIWDYDPPRMGGWYQFGLLFETEQVMDMTLYPGLEFLPAPSSMIWRAMRIFAQAFPGVVIYFLHEAAELPMLYVLETQQGNLWQFELALLPSFLVPRFEPIPDTYTCQEVTEGLAVAQRACWPVLPWLAEAAL